MVPEGFSERPVRACYNGGLTIGAVAVTYSIKEIFYTLQGEGAHAGRPAVFCRFSGCNLWTGRESDRATAVCTFCDTDFVGTDGELGGKFPTALQLAQRIDALWPATHAASKYVVFTGGMACVALATCMWVVDVHRVRWWTKPFVIYGVNPMIAFLGSGLMARLIYSVLKVQFGGTEVSLQSAIFQSAYASWLSPVNASLAFALSFVLFWLAILAVLYRRNIFLKV